jgi:hypothetical protein
MVSNKSANQMSLPLVHRLWKLSEARRIAIWLKENPIGSYEGDGRCLLLGKSTVSVVDGDKELRFAFFTVNDSDICQLLITMGYHRSHKAMLPNVIESTGNMYRPVVRNLFCKTAGIEMRVGEGVRGLWKLTAK